MTMDGVSVYFDDWWFNVRPSNTEPLLRLNLEADSEELMEEKMEEVVRVIKVENKFLEVCLNIVMFNCQNTYKGLVGLITSDLTPFS